MRAELSGDAVGFAAALAPVAAIPGAGETTTYKPGDELLAAVSTTTAAAAPPPAAVYVITHGTFTVHGADGKPTGATLKAGDFVGAVAFTFNARPHLTVKASSAVAAAEVDAMDDLASAAPPPEARAYALPWTAMPTLRTSPELRPIFEQMQRCARLTRAAAGELTPLPAAAAAGAVAAGAAAAAAAGAATATGAAVDAGAPGAVLDPLTLLTVAVKQVKEDKNMGVEGRPGRPAALAGLGDEPAVRRLAASAVG